MADIAPPPPRRRLLVRIALLALIALALAAVAAGIALARDASRHRVRLLTGPQGGIYLPLGQALAEAMNRDVPSAHVEAIETPGGAFNSDKLSRGECELALMDGDTLGGPRVRLIAPLFEEVLHVAVRDDRGIERLQHLAGRRVAIGPPGSSTSAIARRVLAHFDIAPAEFVELPHAEAAGALAKGDVDAVFAVAGIGAPLLARLVHTPGARLLSLGDADRAGSALDGIRIGSPYFRVTVIPERAYGSEPSAPVGTVGVLALLVADRDLPDSMVHDLTKALFENKAALVERVDSVARLSEDFDRAGIRFPVHPGATDYYHRNEPPFLVVWADAISLGITVVLLVWSGLAALRSARKRWRKDRVDVFYLEVQEAASELHDSAPPVEALLSIRRRLHEIRRHAFDELVAERLEANESFTIFQDYLRSELATVETALREHGQRT